MQLSSEKLRENAQQIWWAGVEAVRPCRLIPEHVVIAGNTLGIGGSEIDLAGFGRIVVVGAGKASGAMAAALEAVFGEQLLHEKRVEGWVNVPADCMQPTRAIRLHASRPAGVNEPASAGVEGTKRILELVRSLGPSDLCICLISGGGSALLPAPCAGFSLEAKTTLTREISARGGTIQQLNAVRRELSEVKGGGLARACRAGRLETLILSDVLGDDLETIASGPTVLRKPTPKAALQVLEDLQLLDQPAGRQAAALLKGSRKSVDQGESNVCQISNHIIGNNATAVDAAGIEAERLGYSHAMISATSSEGTAEEVAQWLSENARSMQSGSGPDCLISGGEPNVTLAPEAIRGKGGRNQQLALAALNDLENWEGLALLSGGTDGEDGPTDAAGAVVDEQVVAAVRVQNLNADDYMRRNDAYRFFDKVDGLMRTGPTQTNVCDVRVVVCSR